jgi:hypothetical protein
MSRQHQKSRSTLAGFVKFFYNAFKSIFVSQSKDDFVRLKNFISS